MSERADLTSRILPHMTLGTGAPGTLTAPPPPLPSSATPSERAALRFGLHGQHAVVTGGAGDLGSAAARALLEHGLAGLVIFDRMAASEAEPRVAALRAEFPAADIGFSCVDITDEARVEEAMGEAEGRFRDHAASGSGAGVGGIDVVLNFAGMVGCGPETSTTAAAWDRMLAVNLTGGATVARAAGRAMIARGRGGSIVLVASVSGHQVNYPQPQAAYNASKAGLRMVARSLAAEWAVHGVRVNTISPGYMATVLNEGDGLAEGRRLWASRNPTGRMGEPDELSGAVVLLASRAGSYITGTDLRVDGGQTLLM
ncbi:hypothetical protein SLS62_004988 [Diatrype stigma]|uniref:Uncharacterized protein n=1 Tax=Diatrype stigma TaxID=117547 RepID=A0AAN9UPU7_9PEZI